MPLPTTCCLFNDVFVSDQDPRVLYRYAVVNLEFNEREEYYELKPHEPDYGPRTLALYETPIEEPIWSRIMPIRLRVSETVTKNINVWFTGEIVTTYHTFDIPMIDVSSREDLDTMEIFNYRLIDDTVEACRQRQNKQRISRHGYRPRSVSTPPLPLRQAQAAPAASAASAAPASPAAPAAPASPPHQAAQAEIPKFVANLIKAEAIRDKKTCPITMNTVTAETSCSITSCFHLFDRAALATWMEKESKCPICKSEVTFTVAV